MWGLGDQNRIFAGHLFSRENMKSIEDKALLPCTAVHERLNVDTVGWQQGRTVEHISIAHCLWISNASVNWILCLRTLILSGDPLEKCIGSLRNCGWGCRIVWAETTVWWSKTSTRILNVLSAEHSAGSSALEKTVTKRCSKDSDVDFMAKRLRLIFRFYKPRLPKN